MYTLFDIISMKDPGLLREYIDLGGDVLDPSSLIHACSMLQCIQPYEEMKKILECATILLERGVNPGRHDFDYDSNGTDQINKVFREWYGGKVVPERTLLDQIVQAAKTAPLCQISAAVFLPDEPEVVEFLTKLFEYGARMYDLHWVKIYQLMDLPCSNQAEMLNSHQYLHELRKY
jgi:hypothetical protein